jgi:HD-GYP domain-containing protein (c-di-GMP phosphodiesterase class II)
VDEALAEMVAQRAKHFDPDVLDAFLSSLDDMLAIRSELADA